MEIQLPNLLSAAMLIGLRISGLMLFAPFLGSMSVPRSVKALLTITITAVLYPVFAPQIQAIDLSRWLMAGLRELLIGIALGITTNVVFEAVQFAGQILSIQMGYSLVNILDPTSQVETTVVSAFHQTIAILIFLRMDVHHWIIRAVAHSFEYLPTAAYTLHPDFVRTILYSGGSILSLGLQIAAPVLSATLMTDVALGLVGKAAPQIQLMLVGPALKTLSGLGLLMVAITFWPAMFDRFFSNAVMQFNQMLQLTH